MDPRGIDVLFFAQLAERVGSRRVRVELEGPQTVQGLWEHLIGRWPGLAETGFRPLVACDMEYADWERGLEGVREVAFLPPVSGG